MYVVHMYVHMYACMCVSVSLKTRLMVKEFRKAKLNALSVYLRTCVSYNS